ncbi:hypothetical protein JTB14_021364 [Gonioctena quinquepunctata]|nr:hypothetical protein JTB14_021364 [Gonioctena quinquepunctata]
MATETKIVQIQAPIEVVNVNMSLLTVLHIPGMVPKEQAKDHVATNVTAHVKSTGNDWFLDSGCSAHLTVDKSNFISEETSSKLTITTANDQQMETNCVGDIQLPVTVSDQYFNVNVENVFYVPDLKTFFFPDPDHESDSGPPIEDFSDEESDDSSGEEPPNFEEDQSDPDFILSRQTTSLPEQHLRRGDRIRRPPQTHDDYVSYSGFVENFSNPTSVEEVLASPDKENWLKAMDREYKAQIDNGTWEFRPKTFEIKMGFQNKEGC